MEPKKFTAQNMSSAMKLVKHAFGDDAVIISTQTINNQVQVEALPYMPENNPAKVNIRVDDDDFETNIAQFDDIILAKQATLKEDDIKNELAKIKAMLQEKPYQEKTHHPVIRQLSDKLRLLGYGKDLIQYILMDIDVSKSMEDAWQQAVRKIVGDILIDNTGLSKKKIKAIVGPNGVGKTMFMSRFAYCNQLLAHPKQVAFIFVNHSNIKTIEEANAFSRLYQTPALHVETLNDLMKSMHHLSAYEHIIIEFPGYDFNCPENNFYMKFIQDYQSEMDITLVMNTNAPYAFFDRYINLFQHVFINGMVITKLDEFTHLEGIIQANLKYRIPLRYFTSGASLLEYIDHADKSFFYHYLAVPEIEATKLCQTQV